MLVSPIIAQTIICIQSRARGGTFIRLFPIVSISSINDMMDIPIPIMRTMRNRFSRRGEKFEKKNIKGERRRRIKIRAIPTPYGAGFRPSSLL